MSAKIEGLIFMSIMLVCGVMAGCDKNKFKKENPVAAEVIEATVDIAEEAAEDVIEKKFNLPADSLDFNIQVFPENN